MDVCVGVLSSKGQVVIAKAIRDQLGLEKNQPLRETIQNGKIILEPLPKFTDLGGLLKGKSNKSVAQMMREADQGWD